MGIIKKRVLSTIAGASTLMITCVSPAQAANNDLVPEVLSTVWLEDDQECASVSINGRDIVTYKGNQNAEKKAQDLSRQLVGILRNSKLRTDELLPAQEGQLALVKVGDKTVLKFEPPKDNAEATSKPIESGFKIVNALRQATGEQKLPESFISIANAFTGGDTFKSARAKSAFSGKASWYGRKFHGRRAANGERYDMHKLTAAHKKLPFGTKLLVKNRKTGKTCIVRVTDRGPYHGNRVIDLSMGAAKKLNMMSQGVAMVDVIVLGM